MPVMLSSQGIGLIAAIALSGCSVMLLMLGRQKLLELKKDSSRLQTNVSEEGGLGSHCCEHHLPQHAEGGTSISRNLMNSGKRDYGNLCSKGLWKSSPTALTDSESSRDKRRKKVRFSEDVVEPCGDNAAYRRRHALVLKSGQPARSLKPDNICCESKGIEKPIDHSKSDAKQRRVERNIPANRMALYIGICNDRSRRAFLH